MKSSEPVKLGEIDKMTAALAKSEGELKEKSDQLDVVQKQLEAATTTGIKLDEIGPKLAELGKAKADLEQQVAELKQVQDSLKKQVSEAEGKATTAKTQVDQYKAEYTKPGVTGTVLAYNPGWNFVVLSIGDKQSLKAGKVLVVTRGGQMVARVRVTSVEPTSSIADVIPSSVTRGESVQPGDSVVYEGRAK